MISILRDFAALPLFRMTPKIRLFLYILINVGCITLAFHCASWVYDDYWEKEQEYAELKQKLTLAKTLTHKHQDLLTNSFLQGQYVKLKKPYEQETFEDWLRGFCKTQGCSAVLSLSSNTHQTHADHRSILTIPLTLSIQSFTDKEVFLLMNELIKQAPYVVEIMDYRIVRHKSGGSETAGKGSVEKSKGTIYPFEAKIDALVLNLVE